MTGAFASRSALNEAVTLINTGQINKVLEICRSAIAGNPDDINMVALFGATLMKTRKVSEAEKYLRQAIRFAHKPT